MMIGGYLTTIIAAMIPPLWHKLMIPKVLEWDRKYASDEERILAAQANEKSGIPAFKAALKLSMYKKAAVSAAEKTATA